MSGFLLVVAYFSEYATWVQYLLCDNGGSLLYGMYANTYG